MTNVLAAKILMSHLPEITDNAYKTATEIAIETLLKDAINDYTNIHCDTLTLQEYLDLSDENYNRWIRKEIIQ